MKKLILFLILLFPTSGATFPFILFHDFTGPYTVIAGSNNLFSYTARLGFNWTVNSSTDVFTVTGGTYTPTNGDNILLEETNTLGWTGNTLPSGAYGMVSGYRGYYVVCDSSGATFKLRQDPDITGNCTGKTQLDVTTTGSGTQTAVLYKPGTDFVYLNAAPTGFPTGTTFSYKVHIVDYECHGAAPTSNGKVYEPLERTVCIFANVPSNATPGTSTIHIELCATDTGTNCTTFDWPINVIAPPTITHTPPSSFSSLPGKTAWEQVMVARPCPGDAGNNYQGSQCGMAGDSPTTFSGPANYIPQDLANPSPVNYLGAATNQGVSRYGWNILFDNMAIYTGNYLYRTGAFQVGMGHTGTSDLQSVRYYVTNNGGNLSTFVHHTESLFRAGRVFNDSTYITAGLLMQNNAIIQYGGNPGLVLCRENSLALQDGVELYKYGGLTMPYWDNVRETLYMLAIRATESDASGVRYPQQGFMIGGISVRAIIEDWQVSGDTRAEFIIKRILDYLWTFYNQTTHAYMNIEGPAGTTPWCSDSVLWFLSSPAGGCGVNDLQYQSLQGMLVGGFYWYYAMTGDTTYRDRGDDMFAHIFDQGGLTGKQASEVYWDSFNAVAWRTGTLSPYKWYGDADILSHGISGTRNLSGTRNIQ